MGQLDAKDRRIAELETLLRAALARIADLEVEVANLKRQVGQNSNNTSRPPSSDGPGVEHQPKAPTGRKPGAQPGRKGK